MTNNAPANNPLINWPNLPNGAPPLDTVKTEHYLPALEAAIAEAKKEVAAIRDNKAAPTFANTIEALEFSGLMLTRVSLVFNCIAGANSNDAMRAIEEEIQAAQVRHGNDVMMDAALFARVKTVYDGRAQAKLTSEETMLLEKTYKGFVRSGALLNDAGKQELRDVSEKLSALKTAYKNNNVKSTAAYKKVIDREDDLKGLPERVKEMYAAMAAEESLAGKWLVKLSPPPIDLLEYAENRALREEIWRAYNTIAYKDQFDNSQIVIDIVKLQRRKAQLLGYADYPAYQLDERMAKNVPAVMTLLEKNLAAYKPAAEEFLQKVKDFAKAADGITDLQPWDLSIYSRKLKEKTFDLDMEAARPYFDLEKVLEGLREHAEKLFNISMTPTDGKYPVYHPDVKTYEVHDNKTGALIGVFYADYYARAGAKNGGAWMSNFRERGDENGVNKCAVVYNICNFDKPSPGNPTLLSLRDVETVFHEFGHGLHSLLAEGKYSSLTGTNVKWDFVEAPSQIQENWVHEKEVLDTFARHYKTGEAIPADMVQKIKDMGNFDAGYQGLRQTFFGLLDMTWYTTDPAEIKSVEQIEDAVTAKAWLFPRLAGPMSTHFGHIFGGGYSAGYYSYKWAEVMEADMFERFKEKGLYDADTAKKFRALLAAGGTREPMELFVAMMGREPDPDALLRREGLLPANNNTKPAQRKI